MSDLVEFYTIESILMIADSGRAPVSGSSLQRKARARCPAASVRRRHILDCLDEERDGLEVLPRCGLTPNSENRRCTALFDTSSAIRRTLQASASRGVFRRARSISLVSPPTRQVSEKFDICICADFQTHRTAIPVFAGGTSLVMPNPFGRNRCPFR